VDDYLQLATKYDGTMASQRAQLQAAALLFNAARYADAESQFQKFFTDNTGSELASTAMAGAAACLESLGKLDEALIAYRSVVTAYPDSMEAVAAKFSIGRVLELQGKFSEAVTAYQEVTRLPLSGSLASESAQRIALIQAKLPAAKPAA